MRAVVVLIALGIASCAGDSNSAVNQSDADKQAFCADHPLMYKSCTVYDPYSCKVYEATGTCMHLLDALPSSCDATFDDVAACIQDRTCPNPCKTVCGVTFLGGGVGCP